MTSLPAEADGTAGGTVSEGAKGESIFPTSSSLTQRAHNSHITRNNFFPGFNNVDLFCSMLADCCMPWCQEWGTMMAVGGRQLPWLAYVYFTKLYLAFT